MKCSIYKNRPDICKRYPEHRTQTHYYEKCSYSFVGVKRIGECNRCGQCCFLKKDIHGFGNTFVKGDPCPYLELKEI